MSLPKERITFLLEAYTSGTATAQQEQELMEWIQEAEEGSELKVYMQEVWSAYRPGTLATNNVDWNSIFEDIMNKEKVHTIPPRIKHVYQTRLAAVAIIILLFSLAGFFYANQGGKQVAKTETKKLENDIAAPQNNNAILTLSDGSKIVLDSAAIGSLAVQGNVDVVKNTDGHIAYKGDFSASSGTERKYNTLTVPKGSKPAHLQLADGSHVWVNVASSITYPTAFTGNERKVQLTGEAYFEVTSDKAHPFLVQTEKQTVSVLGTQFNVNAYNDEPSIKTTLLEGSVRVEAGTDKAILKPGQQAMLALNKLQVVSVDVDDVTAWKNGVFQFSDENLQSIMRKLSRWYNVDIEYENDEVKALPLTGIITHFNNISKVLRMLELTKRVHFKIEERKIIVLSGRGNPGATK